MTAQPVTAEKIQDLFRLLSRKQRHGVLRVEAPGVEIELLLQEGRIVGVEQPEKLSVNALARRFAAGGRIPEHVAQLICQKKISLTQFRDILVSKHYLSQADFARARRTLACDLLLSLRKVDDTAVVEFTPKLVQADSESALSAYPAQTLLDFAEFNADEEKFKAVFGADNEQVLLQCETGHRQQLLENELTVLDLVDGKTTINDVLARCPLSAYEVTEALLSLHERGFVALRTQIPADQTLSWEDFELGEELHEPSVSEEDEDDEELLLPEAVEEEEPPPLVQEDGPAAEEMNTPAKVPDEETGTEADGSSSEAAENQDEKEAETEVDTKHFSYASLNYVLLDPPMIAKCVSLVASIFLLCLALMLPWQLGRLFGALVNLTGN